MRNFVCKFEIQYEFIVTTQHLSYNTRSSLRASQVTLTTGE